MKWERPSATVQWSADKRYLIVEANSQHWVAYMATPFGAAEELGVRGDAEMAKACCEAHEASLIEERKRA